VQEHRAEWLSTGKKLMSIESESKKCSGKDDGCEIVCFDVDVCVWRGRDWNDSRKEKRLMAEVILVRELLNRVYCWSKRT